MEALFEYIAPDYSSDIFLETPQLSLASGHQTTLRKTLKAVFGNVHSIKLDIVLASDCQYNTANGDYAAFVVIPLVLFYFIQPITICQRTILVRSKPVVVHMVCQAGFPAVTACNFTFLVTVSDADSDIEIIGVDQPLAYSRPQACASCTAG